MKRRAWFIAVCEECDITIPFNGEANRDAWVVLHEKQVNPVDGAPHPVSTLTVTVPEPADSTQWS